MAARIAAAGDADEKTIYEQLRGWAQRGLFEPTAYAGASRSAAALYDRTTLCRARICVALARHGVEGRDLRTLAALLDNVETDPNEPDEFERLGLPYVLERIEAGEEWYFTFHSVSLGGYVGACGQVAFRPYEFWDNLKLVTSIVPLTTLLTPILAADAG